MAAWRYEISLRVLKNISRVRKEENFPIYRRPCNVQEIPNHFTVAATGAIYCVTIVTAIFSRVNISCFARKLTWFFIGFI